MRVSIVIENGSTKIVLSAEDELEKLLVRGLPRLIAEKTGDTITLKVAHTVIQEPLTNLAKFTGRQS
jgi:hypothetical protein